MANPSDFGANASYDRAVAALAEKSYDVARRWVLEALAQNPEHAGARALLGKLDSMRRPPLRTAGDAAPRSSPFAAAAPEAVSTDPTILIGHASRTPPPDEIEPTILVRRPEPRRPPAPDPFAPSRPPERDSTPVSDPTIIRRPPDPPRPNRAQAAPAGGGVLERWRDLFGGRRAAGPRAAAATATAARPGGFSPGMRGAALVAGAVVVAALLLAAGVAAVRWLWPAGQPLTLSRPTGGTILAPGIECGTKGKDCATTRRTGEVVELQVQADAGYVFSGYTGDCAPVGRMAMDAPRTCGARFDRAEAIAAPTTFRLTITKPAGGTIAGEPNILCGTLDDACSADIAGGTPVTMRFQADTNFTFQAFTGDCAPGGELTMNAAKTCGGIFMPTPGGTVVNRDAGGPPPKTTRPPVRRPDDGAAGRSAPAEAAVPAPAAQVQPAAPPPQAQPTVAGPTKDPITPEQHAKDEIESLVKTYCSENETLKPERIQKLFPLAPMATYREQFRQYKTLKCTLTSKLEFQRLDASATGGAQVLFGMKQVIQMKSGGAPKVYETNVTMVVSRTSFQAPWLIDRMLAEEKPK